ncbi:MAG: TldD/PmbA family protein, partial [Polyangiaceae bacterium]
MKRRDLLLGGLSASSLGALAACTSTPSARSPASAAPAAWDASTRQLVDAALSAAREAGASYADVRVADYHSQFIATREARVTRVSDAASRGLGVRVIAQGTWGFAASASLSVDAAVQAARRAVALARANSLLQREPVVLAPGQTHVATWSTPIVRDAFTVPLEQKVERLLSINALATKQPGVTFCNSSVAFVREHKFFASSEGSYIEQTLHRLHPAFTLTSVDRKQNSFQTRESLTDPRGVGYEYIDGFPWEEEVRQAAQDVVQKHTAPSVEPGKKDLLLHPTHLWLTIHESIGHPTELDRALGMEANFAGTSFLTPDKLGSFQLGSEHVSFTAEKTAPGSLATAGYDDDGQQTMAWPLVERGRFVDYQTTRDQAHWIGRAQGYACSYAASWRDVPFQRMPNVNLLPGKAPLSLADLIASTDEAILIKGRGSYSIDHQRYNFQFGGQTFWQIKGGKVVGMLKDVAYQAKTPEFWAACDAVCDEREYYVGGSFFDGKGEPTQSNAVSHGCS